MNFDYSSNIIVAEKQCFKNRCDRIMVFYVSPILEKFNWF